MNRLERVGETLVPLFRPTESDSTLVCVVAAGTGIAEIRRVLAPGGRFFFEEVTRAALERWLYRTFLKHPAENRFSEAEFLAELANHGLQSMGETRKVLFGDIFIGAAKLQETSG